VDRYPPIVDHGLIGDLQTAALVTSQGVVDWFAAPRFEHLGTDPRTSALDLDR